MADSFGGEHSVFMNGMSEADGIKTVSIGRDAERGLINNSGKKS